MISSLLEYKYYIIGSIILIISGYLIKNVSIKEERIIEKKAAVPNIRDRDLEKLIKSFEDAIKKSVQTVIKFNENAAMKTNYLNMRNELFTKDIIKKKILIDSASREMGDSNNYKVNLSKTSDKFKNVIGFRLIECAIPMTSRNINANNDKLILVKGDVSHTINFDQGEYTFTELGNHIKTKIATIDGTFNLVADVTGEDAYTYTMTRASDLFFKFKQTGNSFYKLLGYDNIDETVQLTASNNINHTIEYLDIVIDNIPEIACKVNSNGNPVIDRVMVNVSGGTLLTYRVPESETQTSNYFYPLSLNEVNIKILTPEGQIYDNKSGNNFFEFEVTILENTKLMN